jgi:hypothetical protein
MVHTAVGNGGAGGDAWMADPSPSPVLPTRSTCRTSPVRSENLGLVQFSPAPTTTERDKRTSQKP